MTTHLQPNRHGGHRAILYAAMAALLVVALVLLLPAEPMRQALAAACSRIQGNMGSLAGLGLGLSILAVFNFAFWRHLRRAYASPRRGRRRDR